jgi:HNH endonuclease
MSAGILPVSYRPIPGFPGYRAGDDGSIWSCLGRRGSFAYVETDTWKRLALTPVKGRLTVTLYRIVGDKRKRRLFGAHQLVMLAFVGPCPDGQEVCHADDNHSNNYLTNLRYDTPKGNAADRERNGKHPHGTQSKLATITDDTVRAIRSDHATGKFTLKKLSAKYGPHYSQISNIVRRKQWAHLE